MGKVVILIHFFFFTFIFSQKKIVVEFSKEDSLKIEKVNKDIYIYIYYEKNIEYNKTQKKVVFPDGIVCETCKLEVDVAIVEKPVKKVKNIKIIPAKEWKKEYNLYYINPLDYIKIGDYYYKYTGTVIQ